MTNDVPEPTNDFATTAIVFTREGLANAESEIQQKVLRTFLKLELENGQSPRAKVATPA